MSVKLRLIQPFVLAGIALVALATPVAASQSYDERVAGFETGPVTQCINGSGDASSFAGSARGTLNGTFAATICHTPLVGAHATINPGGSFTVSGTSTTGQPGFVTGQFTDGSVDLLREGHFGSFCYQIFSVSGHLSHAPDHQCNDHGWHVHPDRLADHRHRSFHRWQRRPDRRRKQRNVLLPELLGDGRACLDDFVDARQLQCFADPLWDVGWQHL